MSVQIERRHFNVTEFNRMAEAGIFTADDRVELIEGEIIEISLIGSRHAACVGRLTELFGRRKFNEAIVWVQNPVHMDDHSEPIPDIALLKRRDDFYAEAHPSPADVLLIVEVADASLGYDRIVKLSLYARANIPEVWIVDLPEEIIELYAQPADGIYQTTKQAARDESFASQQNPQLTFEVNAILG